MHHEEGPGMTNPRKRREAYVLWLTAALLLTVLALAVAACGDEKGELTETQSDGDSTHATGTSTSGTDMGGYASDMRDLAGNADRVNSDYRDQADRQRAGEIDTATLIERARDGERDFQIMVDELKQATPPAGLVTAHAQLTTAFGKWLEFYGLQISGLENNDAAQLSQAMELDIQAVTEANQAIEAINSQTAASQ